MSSPSLRDGGLGQAFVKPVVETLLIFELFIHGIPSLRFGCFWPSTLNLVFERQ